MKITQRSWLCIYRSLWILFHLLISPHGHTAEFSFDNIKIPNRYPNRHTLMLLDKDQLFGKTNVETWPEDYDPIKNYLTYPLQKEKLCHGKPNSQNTELYQGYITLHTGRTPNNQPYFVVKFLKKYQGYKLEALLDAMTGEESKLSRQEFELSASLVFLPQSTEKSLVYGYRYWSTLLNSDAIVPQWGLRLLASQSLFDSRRVKEVGTRHFRGKRPCVKRERTAELELLDHFDLTAGAEEIEYIRAFPKSTYNAKHLMRGGHCLQFSLSSCGTREETLDPMADLYKVAIHFFSRHEDPENPLHEKIRPFLDEPVRNAVTIEQLNQTLMDRLRQGITSETYIHDSVWRRYGSLTLFFGESQNSSLFGALRNSERQLTSPIKVRRTEEDEKASEGIIGKFIYTLPIEHHGQFYRFTQGRWYKVDKSRFTVIRGLLRKTLLPNDRFPLPDYEYQDTKTEGNGVTYKEANYNRRVISQLPRAWSGLLLDRLLVSLGGSHNVFEFADQIFFDGTKIYLVHVKRAGAGDLSHHREQVERCAEYLATEIDRNGARNLLVKGAINHLYASHQLSLNKVEGQEDRLTHGDEFLKLYKKAPAREDRSFEDVMKSHFLHIPFGPLDQSPWAKLRRLLRDKIDYAFFKDHEAELISSLDALYDCVKAKKLILEEHASKIDEFLQSMRQAIEAQKLLFRNGVLSKEDREKISIVMAVIDDRRIDAVLKREKELEKQPMKKEDLKRILARKEADPKGSREKRQTIPLFKDQHLWGLERTYSLVSRYGFDFKMVITNGGHDDQWDCFGDIQPAEDPTMLENNALDEEGFFPDDE